MLNHIVLMGRLTRDPELRRTGSGVAVASFTLAVDRDYRPENGEREVDFINIVAWRSTAEFVSRYFSKGRMAVVSGRLQIRNWTDTEGSKRRSAEVVADNIYFGNSKRDSDRGGGQNNSGQQDYGAPQYGGASDPGYQSDYGAFAAQPTSAAAPGDFAILEDDDSELPF